MHLKLLTITAFTLLLSGCFGIGGSGNVITQTIDLDSPIEAFTLALSGSQLELVDGDSNQLEVTTDDNLLDELLLDINGSELKLTTKGHRSLRPTDKILVRLTLSDISTLSELTLAGTGDIVGNKLTTDQLSITLAGSGDINLTELNTQELKVTIAGSGDVHLSGQSTYQAAKIAGSGEYDAYDFISRSASVTVAGSGDMNLYVTKKLDVMITGSGTINVKGDPEINSTIFGSGDINRVE